MNTPRLPNFPPLPPFPALDSLPSLAPLLSIPLMAAAAFVPALSGGCAPRREITRVDPNTVVDVNQQWNDVDARATYQHMVQDALSRPWIDNFVSEHGGRRPVVVVGPVDNATQTYIDTKMFTTDIERELINSGKVRFVADKTQRDAVRDERIQAREWARPETQKQLKAETGADYIMLGRVMQDSPRTLDGRAGVQFYKVNLEVIDLETNEKVYIGTRELKKLWRDQ
ncbi:MAG: penicillin-binding protein activator LpoB [Phycisphaerales bacterium]|nr:penicillin-binding protein activator LpoB [Phycisphaerales bacterium]